MLPLKLLFNGEIRRVNTSVLDRSSQPSFTDLVCVSRSLFPVLSDKTLIFLWIDEEGDTVSCSTDVELKEALRVMESMAISTFKFEIIASSCARLEDRFLKLRRRVSCDNCGMKPIVGARYKCTVRENFDLCSSCERFVRQPFPMLKVYSPEQCPELMVVVCKTDAYCPSQHTMQRLFSVPSNYHGTVICDKCETKINCELGFNHCGLCQYDVCSACASFSHAGDRVCVLGKHGLRKKWSKVFRRRVAGDFCSQDLPVSAAAHMEQVESVVEGLNNASHSAVPLVETFVQTICEGSDQSRMEQLDIPVEEDAGREARCGEFLDMSTSMSTSPLLCMAPSMKFVADVTFPDSSVVQACSVLTKVWRIKNDGNAAWPVGVYLSACGGDCLSGDVESFDIPCRQVLPGDVIEVSVVLTVPRLCGRFVAYYRLTTAEGKHFGQRLWADLNVVDEDEGDWDMVMLSNNPEFSDASVSARLEQLNLVDCNKAEGCESSEKEIPAKLLRERIESPMVPDLVVQDHVILNPVVQGSVAETVTVEQGEASSSNSDETSKWAREIFLLREMGFGDLDVFPLLERYLPQPEVLCESTRMENLQALIIVLLSRVEN